MSYTDDTEFAIRNLIDLATREEAALAEKVVFLNTAEQRLKVHQWDFQTSDLNEDFSDVYVMAAFARAAQAARERDGALREIDVLRAAVGTHQVAVQAICGSILQIAKQGISLVHGGLAAAPQGRLIGKSYLKDVVWQARNQASHFDEGSYRSPVVSLFAALEESHGNSFCLAAHPRRSLARQVVHLLGWTTYEGYLADARALGL